MLKHILAFTLIFCTANYAQEPGRTDGAEGSEFGRGGYRMSNIKNPWQIKVSFGSARVNSDGEFAEKREVHMRKHSQQFSKSVRTSARRKQGEKMQKATRRREVLVLRILRLP